MEGSSQCHHLRSHSRSPPSPYQCTHCRYLCPSLHHISINDPITNISCRLVSLFNHSTFNYLHFQHNLLPPSPPCLGNSQIVRHVPLFRLLLWFSDYFLELKNTHLAPLANTFGRSSSASTVTPEAAPRPPSTTPSTATTLVDGSDPTHIGMLISVLS
jgi:hypothetical protein